jgi:hypothetical protein
MSDFSDILNSGIPLIPGIVDLIGGEGTTQNTINDVLGDLEIPVNQIKLWGIPVSYLAIGGAVVLFGFIYYRTRK